MDWRESSSLFKALLSSWVCRQIVASYYHPCYYFLRFTVQYAVHLYRYFQIWRKNPHWSFSCCLALFLPLLDMPGDISGLVGTNICSNQLQTGEIEMPTILGTVKNSKTFDITLKVSELDGSNPRDVQKENCNDSPYKNKKYHKGSQTELLTIFSIPDVVVPGPVEETHL